MKLKQKITIDKPINDVWDVLAINFDKASDWMAVIPKSIEKIDGDKVNGAPMEGRICDLSHNPNGAKVDETILKYNDQDYKVVPFKGKIPIKQNIINFYAYQLANDKTEVVYDSDIALKTAGKLIYPALKLTLKKNFKEQMEDLKCYVETGIPHERKLSQL